jgi:NADH-quinone oxidoreductase subunit H
MAILSNFINQFFIDILALINITQDTALFIALIVKVIVVILIIVMCVAYTTWLERKIHGLIHLRKGPNVVGAFGLLQPLYDGIKLIFKETIIPLNANKLIFFMAPILTFVVALLGWVVIPIDNGMAFSNLNIGAIYLLAISSLSVYGLIMAGYSSNSQFSLLGAIRSSSQMISYELSMGMIVLCVALISQSLNLNEIIIKQTNLWNFITLFPLAILFFIVILAETNRHPFDLPEGEADIVGGFHTEYSGFLFALFFLAEYANMILMSSFFTILFLGGWLPLLSFYPFNLIPGFVWFILKIIVLLFFIIQVRAVVPRYRYDQLMSLGWKVFLPITFLAFFIISIILRLTMVG